MFSLTQSRLKKQNEPRYDSDLKDTYRIKQLLYKKFMRKPDENNRLNYNKVKNKYERMIKNKNKILLNITRLK